MGLAAVLVACVPATAVSQESIARQPDGAATRRVVTAVDDHPTVKFGDVARIDALLKLQLDWHDADGPGGLPDGWDLRLARAGIGGEVLKRIEYQVERELDDDTDPWRDVYVDVEVFDALQVRAGKFKVPFSLDRLTGVSDFDFVTRSLAASSLSPGRDVGVAVHGRVFDRTVRYDAGVFRHGGDNVRASERESGERDRLVAVRLAVSPWRGGRTSRVRALTFGAGVTSGNVPEGLNDLRVRTVADDPLFPRVYVKGSRVRYGADVEWTNGPFGMRGELMRVRDERRGQGTDDNDLPEVRSDGGYMSGTWLLTGERKSDSVRPLRPAPHRGFGAVELAARFEWIAVGIAGSGPVSGGPRAERLATQRSRAVTLGGTWYLNRFVRLQMNVIREHRIDTGSTIEAQPTWTPVIRFQLAL